MRRLARPVALAALFGALGGLLALAPAAQADPGAALDPTYGDGGIATLWGPPTGEPPEVRSPWAISSSMDELGRAVVTGASAGGGLWRLAPDGTPDPTFGESGIVGDGVAPGFSPFRHDATADAIAIGGWYHGGLPSGVTAPAVLKLDDGGNPDPSFDGDGVLVLPASPTRERVADVALAADGSVTFLTVSTQLDGGAGYSILRHEADGSPDGTFGVLGAIERSAPGGWSMTGVTLAVDSSGRSVVVEYLHRLGAYSTRVLRLLPDGTLDPAFGSGGVTVLDGFGGHAIDLDDRDGGVVIGARCRGAPPLPG